MPRNVRNTVYLTNAGQNTINGNINSLMASNVWADATLTYSFPTAGNQFLGYNANDEPAGFIAAADPYKNASRYAFNTAAEVANIKFQEVAASITDPANFKIAVTSRTNPKEGLAGWAYQPDAVDYSGDVWMNANQKVNDPFGPGSYNWSTVVHEIGHALGLNHPFPGKTETRPTTMDPARDSSEWTIMAYRASTTIPDREDTSVGEPNGGPQTWMQYDVAALQQMYGANYTTRAGNTVYTWSSSTGQMSVDGVAWGVQPTDNRIMMNVWDGGGIDTYDFNNYTNRVLVDLAPGGWSTPSSEQLPTTVAATGLKAIGSISNSLLVNDDLRSVIENARGGAGNDVISGNQVANTLWGGRGADALSGLAGNDVVIGDGPLSLTSNALAIKRLYISTLSRGPDDAGWQDWTARRDGGLALTDIATGFVGSQEFVNKYGALDNSRFVTELYRNVLNREPDQAGFNVQLNALNSGAVTRSQLVVNFSESQELKNGSAIDLHAGQVYRLYGATLARAPDAAGFETWTDALSNGRGIINISAGFVGSTEFQTRFPGQDSTGFVTLLYQNVLGRAPDAGGLSYWKGQLDSNTQSKTQVVIGFSESAEYINSTRTATDTFMRNVMTAWSDTLVGGAGNDSLTGGRGSDRFVFTASEGGNDVIYGFESFDTLELNGFGYVNSAAALAAMAQQGSNVVLSYNGGSITFADTQLSMLQSMTAQGWVLG